MKEQSKIWHRDAGKQKFQIKVYVKRLHASPHLLPEKNDTKDTYWYKSEQGKICGKVHGSTLYEVCSSQLQSYEMICSLETYVLDVVGGSCEGKPTSSEGAGVRGELWRMLWLTF